MNVKHATAEQIQTAAEQVGVRVYNLHATRSGFTFTIKTGEPSERREDWRGKSKLMPRYQRTSQRERQSTAKGWEGVMFLPVVPGAVCWHGHRDFLRALFALAPDAIVKTAMATYRGARHFEQSHGMTRKAGGQRMGYPMVPYADACTCE